MSGLPASQGLLRALGRELLKGEGCLSALWVRDAQFAEGSLNPGDLDQRRIKLTQSGKMDHIYFMKPTASLNVWEDNR